MRMAEDFAARFDGSADALSLAGDADLAAGDAELALQHYRASASIRRSWPLTRRMIMAYRTLGQDAQASSLLTEYLRGDPNNLEAAAFLAGVLAKESKPEMADRLQKYIASKLGPHSTLP